MQKSLSGRFRDKSGSGIAQLPDLQLRCHSGNRGWNLTNCPIGNATGAVGGAALYKGAWIRLRAFWFVSLLP